MAETSDDPIGLTCQMCGAAGRPQATHCLDCGAALPLLETVGDLVVPGVTHVDPNLQVYANQPLRLTRGSATEKLAPGALHTAALLGGPAGLAALGAIAAVAANELRSSDRDGPSVPPERLGEISPPVLEVAQRLQKERAKGA